jgi:hypothetical protein
MPVAVLRVITGIELGAVGIPQHGYRHRRRSKVFGVMD